MKELGEGSRDMTPSQMGWDINPRALGVVPKEAKVFFLKGFHWILDAHLSLHPEGVSRTTSSTCCSTSSTYMLAKEAQATTYDDGYFYPGPAVKDVPMSMAPEESQKVITEYGRAEYAAAITGSAGTAAAPGRQTGLRVHPLGRAGRRAKEEVTTKEIEGDWRPLSPVFFCPLARLRGKTTHMAIAARDFRELRLDGMSRNFGAVNALKGVDLKVRRGEFIALLGPPAAANRRHSTASLAFSLCRAAASGSTTPHRRVQAGRTWFRHGIPELRAVPAHERTQEYRLRSRHAGPFQAGDQAQGR